VKVAAYQAPLEVCGDIPAVLALIREHIEWCEGAGVRILCCPETVLGGLADNATRPADIGISVEDGQLERLLAPLASSSVYDCWIHGDRFGGPAL
jgi:hypothetical protein